MPIPPIVLESIFSLITNQIAHHTQKASDHQQKATEHQVAAAEHEQLATDVKAIADSPPIENMPQAQQIQKLQERNATYERLLALVQKAHELAANSP